MGDLHEPARCESNVQVLDNGSGVRPVIGERKLISRVKTIDGTIRGHKIASFIWLPPCKRSVVADR